MLITGATRGIGRAAAIELARRGAEIAIVGREPERVRQTAREARASGGGAPVHEHVSDLMLMAEVRTLAAEVKSRYGRIDVLANNAGAMFGSRDETSEGLERTFALNHLAPFLLTNLLRERLDGGRVVTTASDAHRGGRLDLDDLQSQRSYSAMRVYGTSKLSNILFTQELAKRIAGSGVTANALHPGAVGTHLGQNNGLFAKALTTLLRPFFLTPTRGADTSIYLASSPDVEGVSGGQVVKGFFVHGSPSIVSSSSRSRARPANMRLLMVPSGSPSRSASCDWVKPP